MSSTYRVLCLSHDPAIDTGIESNRPEPAEQAIRDGIDGHGGCDLMIGRYSYPLVGLGCPGVIPGEPRPADRSCYLHTNAHWADIEWLRLLALAQREPDGSPFRLAAAVVQLRCFSPERLRRLRDELDLPTPATTES